MKINLKKAVMLLPISGQNKPQHCDLDLEDSEDLVSQQELPRYEMFPKTMGSLYSASPCSTNASSEYVVSPFNKKSQFASRQFPASQTSLEQITDTNIKEPTPKQSFEIEHLVLESPQCIRSMTKPLEGVGPYFQALEKGKSLIILGKLKDHGDIIPRNSNQVYMEQNIYGFVSKKLINFMDYFECRTFQLKLKNKEEEMKSLISDSSKAYIEMSLDEFKDKFQRNQLSVSKNGIKPKSILKKPTKGQKPEERRLSVGPSALNLETKNQKKVLFSSNYMVLHYTPSRKSSTSKNSTQKRKSSFSNFR